MTGLTRREAVVRGALLAAAATMPLPELAQALRRKPGGPDLDCLSAEDRWLPADVVGDCSLASFSPDGTRIACQTSRGVEIRPRAGGAAILVAPPGFTIGPRAWHPDGSVLLAAGTDAGRPGDLFKDAVPSEPALFAVKTDGSGQTRLLPDVAGVPRAASFSPDGKRAVFTLLDRFVHRMVVADWANGALTSPKVLLPFDPRQETDSGKLSRGLSWYETEGFTPDGQALVFLSDRGAGLLNASVWRIDMTSGKVARVTRDDGFTEGAALTPDGQTLLYGSTRAREPAFMTMISAVGLPPLLGFVAAPTLHETITQRGLAGIGNGDVLAANPASGLFTRLISTRELLVTASKNGLPEAEQRIEVVSMSPSGAEVAVAVWAGAAPALVVLRRQTVPAALAPGPTPMPPTASPLALRQRPGGTVPLLSPQRPVEDLPAIERKVTDRFGGTALFKAEGTLGKGRFSAELQSFSEDGAVSFTGSLAFETTATGFTHAADVRRTRGTEDDEGSSAGFYRAQLNVAGEAANGELHSKAPRRGEMRAVATGGRLVPQDGWKAGRRKASGVVGVAGCRPKKKKRKRKKPSAKKR